MRQRLLALLISVVVRLWLRTLRVERVGPKVQGPGLVAFWHGHQLPLLKVRPEGPLAAPISLSSDGRLQAKIMARFGVGDVPGSSSRGGFGAARGLLRLLRQGTTVLMAVDGPRGPRGVVQPGAIWLAAATGLPIWPVAVAVSAGRELRAWDRFLLPRPWARVVVVFGAPLRFESSGSGQAERLALAIDTAAEEAASRLAG